MDTILQTHEARTENVLVLFARGLGGREPLRRQGRGTRGVLNRDRKGYLPIARGPARQVNLEAAPEVRLLGIGPAH